MSGDHDTGYRKACGELRHLISQAPEGLEDFQAKQRYLFW